MIFAIPDEDKNKCGIYCIRNTTNNAKYIGQTTEGFYNRFIRHSNALENNNHFNNHLQNAYNKYGSENFEMSVVEICNDASVINELEEKYISQFRIRNRSLCDFNFTITF